MHGLIYDTVRLAYHSFHKLKSKALNKFDPPVVILLYHRVTKLLSDPQLLAVTPANFRMHMQYVKDNFPVVRFEEDWSAVKEASVAITFDDGYADNALQALPILEEVGVPATFFVSSGMIGARREFWWDELERIILGDWPFPESFTIDNSRFSKIWPTATPAERRVLYRKILPLIKRIDYESRTAWIERLRQWANAEDHCGDVNRAMTVDELRRLARSKWVTIGAHTINHLQLAGQPDQVQRNEIISSKRQLEAMLGQEIKVFSYPFGTKKDYDNNSVRVVREAGFIKAAANFPGQARRWTDPYRLPRQLIRNWEQEAFVEKMKDFWLL